jgi:hypothetical protein
MLTCAKVKVIVKCIKLMRVIKKNRKLLHVITVTLM